MNSSTTLHLGCIPWPTKVMPPNSCWNTLAAWTLKITKIWPRLSTWSYDITKQVHQVAILTENLAVCPPEMNFVTWNWEKRTLRMLWLVIIIMDITKNNQEAEMEKCADEKATTRRFGELIKMGLHKLVLIAIWPKAFIGGRLLFANLARNVEMTRKMTMMMTLLIKINITISFLHALFRNKT